MPGEVPGNIFKPCRLIKDSVKRIDHKEVVIHEISLVCIFHL